MSFNKILRPSPALPADALDRVRDAVQQYWEAGVDFLQVDELAVPRISLYEAHLARRIARDMETCPETGSKIYDFLVAEKRRRLAMAASGSGGGSGSA
ncbi:hypothetical protein PVAG01_08148 [Phlyctema vagabunda]|uniref:Cobalamin-independent methionine synthase MetE C-terminal/archaeal domain-containing protein n=1 Tax=Phlyctema vagabunda TaxID=108571 RepID=A0ABR4P8K7_9HELO